MATECCCLKLKSEAYPTASKLIISSALFSLAMGTIGALSLGPSWIGAQIVTSPAVGNDTTDYRQKYAWIWAVWYIGPLVFLLQGGTFALVYFGIKWNSKNLLGLVKNLSFLSAALNLILLILWAVGLVGFYVQLTSRPHGAANGVSFFFIPGTIGAVVLLVLTILPCLNFYWGRELYNSILDGKDLVEAQHDPVSTLEGGLAKKSLVQPAGAE